MTKPFLVLLAVLSLIACSGEETGTGAHSRPRAAAAPESPNGTAAASSRGPATAPLVVRVVRVPGLAPLGVNGGEVTLHVRVERTAPWENVKLHVSLPAGAELVNGGLLDEEIADRVEVAERTLVLRLPAGIPEQDVVVSADAGGVGHGAHATAAYRFERPEPKLGQPARSGVPLRVHGKDLGRPIPLSPE